VLKENNEKLNQETNERKIGKKQLKWHQFNENGTNLPGFLGILSLHFAKAIPAVSLSFRILSDRNRHIWPSKSLPGALICTAPHRPITRLPLEVFLHRLE
jgi:hypothetical protein